MHGSTWPIIFILTESVTWTVVQFLIPILGYNESMGSHFLHIARLLFPCTVAIIYDHEAVPLKVLIRSPHFATGILMYTGIEKWPLNRGAGLVATKVCKPNIDSPSGTLIAKIGNLVRWVHKSEFGSA